MLSNSKAETSATTEQTAYDIANNLAPQGDVMGSLVNLNLAGIQLKKTGTRAKSGSSSGLAGGDTGGVGVTGNNSGVQVNLLDGNAINKAFAFAENLFSGMTDTTSRSIDVLSTQLSKDRTSQLAPNTEAGNTITKILFGLGIVVVGAIAYKRVK